MTEDKIIEIMNTVGYSFVKMNDKFSRYDAFDEDRGIMMEIKCRYKRYPDTMIEKMKYQWNKEYAEGNDLEFYYVVSMPSNERKNVSDIYVFDPINMETEEDYDFKWHTKKLPANTEFRGSQWIDKEVGYLHIDDALVILEEKVKH